jgi:hypothetical protein
MAENKARIETEEEALNRELPLRYYGNEDVIGIFADQVVVSHLGGLFTIYFYQMQIPIDIKKPEDAAHITEVPAKCVARLVLTPPLMEQFAKAIETNMTKYKLLIEQQPNKKEE